MDIAALDIILKNFFKDKKVQIYDDVWEKASNDVYKYVIAMHNLQWEENMIIHTKLIFRFDSDKKEMVDNYFMYLYDLDCQYRQVMFKDEDDLKSKLNVLFDDKKFGIALRSISDFMSMPATKLNQYLKNNRVNNISVYEVRYDPKFKIQPCENFSIRLEVNISDTYEIIYNINKQNQSYVIFKEFLGTQNKISVDNISDLDILIGNDIINSLKNIE